jgi:iporin
MFFRRVHTVRHRLGAESGHLSYDKGQLLDVLVCVDSKWLLCAKGALKGLVPREDVM